MVHPVAVREHAVRLAEPRLQENRVLRDRVLALDSDAEPRLAFQLAFSLGEIKDQAAARLANKIKSGALPDMFTLRDVYRRGWTLLNDKDIAQTACDELVALGWLREYRLENLIGRPRSTEYDINPRVRRAG